MVREITESLHALGFDVKKSITENNGAFGMGTFEVHPRQALTYASKYGPSVNLEEGSKRWKKYKMATDITDEKLNEIAKYLKETISDVNAQIIFEPSEKESERDKLRILEIEIFGDGYRDVLGDITTFLVQSCSLNIIRAVVDEPNYLNAAAQDYSAFYCTKKRDTDDSNRRVGSIGVQPQTALRRSAENGDRKPEKKDDTSTSSTAVAFDPTTPASENGPSSALGNGTIRRPSLKQQEEEEDADAAGIILPGGYGGNQTVSARHITTSQTHISSARIKVSQSHISAARINIEPEVTENDCVNIRSGIRRIFRDNGLFECDLLVRMISDTSVVYAPERPHLDEVGDSIELDRRMTFSHLDLSKTPQSVAEVLRRLPSTVHEIDTHDFDEEDVIAVSGGVQLSEIKNDPSENI
jgi:hypothetical protein